jgi:hypothetical protein
MDRGALESLGHLPTRFLCAGCGAAHTLRLDEARFARLWPAPAVPPLAASRKI